MDTVLLIIAILVALAAFMGLILLIRRFWHELKIPTFVLCGLAVVLGLMVLGRGVYCTITYKSGGFPELKLPELPKAELPPLPGLDGTYHPCDCWEWPWDW
jgi:hypothetical protein